MTTTLVFGTPPSIFQPRAFLVSSVSYSFRYWKPSSDTAAYSIIFQVNGGKGMGGQCHIIPRQIGIGGEFLYFDGARGQASSSAACTCLCSPGTKQRPSGFCSNTYLNCEHCTNLHNISSQNTTMEMLSLLKIQKPPARATYIPQAPLGPRHISLVQEVRQCLLRHLREAVSAEWLDALGYRTQRYLLKISWGHDHKITAHNGPLYFL